MVLGRVLLGILGRVLLDIFNYELIQLDIFIHFLIIIFFLIIN
jgi:hypothetical protein